MYHIFPTYKIFFLCWIFGKNADFHIELQSHHIRHNCFNDGFSMYTLWTNHRQSFSFIAQLKVSENRVKKASITRFLTRFFSKNADFQSELQSHHTRHNCFNDGFSMYSLWTMHRQSFSFIAHLKVSENRVQQASI